MKERLLIILLSFTWSMSFGQVDSVKDDKQQQIDSTSVLKYVMKYPDSARRNQIQGVVKIKVTYDSICNILKRTVIQSLGYGCDEEAMKALKSLEVNGDIKDCNGNKERVFPFEFKLG